MQSLQDLYTHISTRHDMSNAGTEIIVLLLVAFILGFLFCYVQGRSHD